MKPHYDWVIVGSGLCGATFARLATDAGLSCLVIEQRDHTGGNIHCEDIAGITVHSYGAHIFHTSDRDVWDFVNRLVPFNRFTNSPIAIAPDGETYNLPFNMNTFSKLWGVKTPAQAARRLEEQRIAARDGMLAAGVTEPRNLEEQARLLVGDDIYRLLIKEYTEKQWGRPCSELPAFIIKRLPVRLTYDNNYFNDSFQGIPEGGYNQLIDKLLDGSDVILSTDFHDAPERWRSMADRMLFTGKIDRYYDYCFGRLQYRTVRFETETLKEPNHQGVAVVNYTTAGVPYTRVIEHKHFETFGDAVYDNQLTVISREYSTEWQEGMEPFYPVNDEHNQALYNRYALLAAEEKDVLFAGRLAEYRYYDMAPLIAHTIDIFKANC